MAERKGVMLASKINMHRLRQWNPPYIVQPKLNGLRGRIIMTDGVPRILSSQENDINSVPHIYDRFAKLAYEGYIPKTCQLDGEFYLHGLSLQDTSSIVKRTTNLHDFYECMNFHVFDFIADLPQIGRIHLLRDMPQNDPLIKIVHTEFVESVEEVIDHLGMFMSDGYEGIIVRNAWKEYIPRRVTHVYKYKPRMKDEYRIIGCTEEISKDGIPKGALGAFICQKDGEQFRVGSGPELTRDNRQEYWTRIEDWSSGRFWAVVKYQELTPDRQVPFHPVVVEVKEAS